MVARTKWRQHCSTCGKQFPPQTWAYCSKTCELARTGVAAGDALDDVLEDRLEPLYEQRLDLRQELEVAMPSDRGRLMREIAANEAREVAMREALEGRPREAVPVGDRAPLRQDQVEFWLPILRHQADKFEGTLRRSLQVAIVLGSRLLQARENLPHGEFGRLFAEHESPVDGALTFTSSWARKLMVIAGNPAVSNREHVHVLPADLGTVYMLSRLPAEELRAAIERGEVTPDMRRADARDLLPPSEEPEPVGPRDEVGIVLAPIRRHLRRFACERGSQFGELKARLRSMLRAIEVEIAGSRGAPI